MLNSCTYVLLPCLNAICFSWNLCWSQCLLFYRTGIFAVFPLFLQERGRCHKGRNVPCPGGTLAFYDARVCLTEVLQTTWDLFAVNAVRFYACCSLKRTGGPSSSPWTPLGRISAVQTGVCCIHPVENFTLEDWNSWPRQRTKSRSRLWLTATQWVWPHVL